MILQPTESDLSRDAESDLKLFGLVVQLKADDPERPPIAEAACMSWIRRAVAAEPAKAALRRLVHYLGNCDEFLNHKPTENSKHVMGCAVCAAWAAAVVMVQESEAGK